LEFKLLYYNISLTFRSLVQFNVNLNPAEKVLGQWFPNFFDAFLPLLILELFLPPLQNFHFSLAWVHMLVLPTIGTMVSIDDNNLINKSGTKTICC